MSVAIKAVSVRRKVSADFNFRSSGRSNQQLSPDLCSCVAAYMYMYVSMRVTMFLMVCGVAVGQI